MSKVGEWLGQAERKLDEWGRPGWIAAMVIGFIAIWPVGLAILGYMIWSGRMNGHWRSNGEGCGWRRRGAARPSGNTAFDAYREATLKRLEEEQESFHAFLDRLRKAKDQAEFDQFMADSRRPAGTPEPGAA